ncbi:hypothetical protein CTEN210_12958 [Chaetoceros tenuissimus]|uniref:RING-type E3 ubiquitin transferase n=1 Tax=Chaetoceros tenuissimus TaxID=426638 RepID=A0AAD3D2N5_9STRA|nr:hypothetical protein CTEN210_12958 [Chaetoceros tenuissimus]
MNEEEELECRVCRGPAEEGRPLFHPCKCSGSIAHTHQDCLQSWLEVKGGRGKCDLCSYKFQFIPKYHTDAPETLSVSQVLSGIFSKSFKSWLPFVLRLGLVIATWLIVLPLCTAYLYQGWTHRPRTISSRLTLEKLPMDLVHGAILTITIIVAFLSLMSLFDFFRIKYPSYKEKLESGVVDEKKEEEEVVIAPVQIGSTGGFLQHDDSQLSLQEKFEAERKVMQEMLHKENKSVMDSGKKFHRYSSFHSEDSDDAQEDGEFTDRDADQEFIDQCKELYDIIEIQEKVYREQIARLREKGDEEGIARLMERRRNLAAQYQEFEQRLPDNAVAAVKRQRHRTRQYFDSDNEEEADESGSAHAEEEDRKPAARRNILEDSDDEEDEDAAFERMMRMQDEDEARPDDPDLDVERRRLQAAAANNAQRFEPQFEPLDRPFDEEDAMDADMQMPMENLIGLRGPVGDLFKNLGWLLAFQTTFIAIFGCIPRAIGSIAFHHVIARSQYLSSTLHFLFKYIIFANFDLTAKDGETQMDLKYLGKVVQDRAEDLDPLLTPQDVGKIVLGYVSFSLTTFFFQAIMSAYKEYKSRFTSTHEAPMPRRARQQEQDMGAAVKEFFSTTIEMTAAAAKISFLVCFKMFVLPFLLGNWLDLSTLPLFESHIEDRAQQMGQDVVGFFILHWVVGITFMLTVTVSVLQLREVLHPELLACVIRPQEPQPDLLLNLLEDSGWTHAKRMVPSLGIYAAILFTQVWFPCCLIEAAGIKEHIPLFNPEFWYAIYMPLQRPIELIIFHLSALSILEKHKNMIGEMQHAFLKKTTQWFGLMDYLLPRKVETWALVAERDLYSTQDEPVVDKFWEKLAELKKQGGPTDEFISKNVDFSQEFNEVSEEFARPNQYIILSPGNEHAKKDRKLLPTHIGQYRCRKKIRNNGRVVIELWREQVSDPIPRPPKGWDYLADGGSIEKGRWSWGKKEKKSDIELRVAARKEFFPLVECNGEYKEQWKSPSFLASCLPVGSKILCLAVLSWIAVTCCVSTIVFAPLLASRFVLQVLSVPTHYMHDPVLFAVGCIMLSPVLGKIWSYFCEEEDAGNDIRRRAFVLPPLRKCISLIKVITLWLGVCPVLTGAIYQYLLFKELPKISELHNLDLLHLICTLWPPGFILLHFGGVLCVLGAFKQQFWNKMKTLAIDGIAGAPIDDEDGNNNNNNANANGRRRRGANRQQRAANAEEEDDGSDPSQWQGKNGKVGRFFTRMSDILLRQEWDVIDEVELVDELLRPVMKVLVTIILAPVTAITSVHVMSKFIPLMQVLVEDDIARNNVMRYTLASAMSIISLFASKEMLQSWYIKAHKTARDHRYLVGELLVNYISSSR